MMDYICRKLDIDDLDRVMDMNRNYREGFICRENAAEFLKNPRNWLFAAVYEGVIIGFAYGYELNRLDGKGNMIYINEVGVMDQYRRQGIGFRMMSELKAACKEKKICRYFLTAYQNNEGANALYKKLGGEVPAESGGNDVVYHFRIK